MSGNTKRPTTEWVMYLGVGIVDPTGWDQDDLEKSMAEPITEAEFKRRVVQGRFVLASGDYTGDYTPQYEKKEETS